MDTMTTTWRNEPSDQRFQVARVVQSATVGNHADALGVFMEWMKRMEAEGTEVIIQLITPPAADDHERTLLTVMFEMRPN